MKPNAVRKIAFVSPNCLVDFTNGAATATRDGLQLLAEQGFECSAYCGTRLDDPTEGLIPESRFRRKINYEVRKAKIGAYDGHLIFLVEGKIPVTLFENGSTRGGWFGPQEINAFLSRCDGPGNVTGEVQAIAGRASAVLSQTWNADGTRATLGVNLGGTLDTSDGTVSGGTPDLLDTYTFDYIGEMAGVAQAGQSGGNTVAPKFATIGYDVGGRMTSVDTYNAGSGGSDYQVTDLAISYDHDSRPTDLTYTGQTGNILAGYHYGYGNRTAKYLSETGALDDTATDITTYTWDNRNRMTSLTQQASYGDDPDLVVDYTYDIFNRMVEEKEITGGSLDERYIYDGNNLLEVLDSGDNPTEYYLNGPAVDQVLSVEQVGGENPGVNWLLADAQGTVRDVVREAYSDVGGESGSGGALTAAVDHLFFDAYGNQTTAQTAADPQSASRIGFQGMMTDPLTFDSGGGALYYSAAEGWYDAVTGTFVTAAAQGYNIGVTNPYEFSGNNPTATDLSMASEPDDSGSAVGVMDGGSGGSGGSGGGTPVYQPGSDFGGGYGGGYGGGGQLGVADSSGYAEPIGLADGSGYVEELPLVGNGAVGGVVLLAKPMSPPFAPPTNGQPNEFNTEVTGIIRTAGGSPEARDAAKSIIQDTKTLELLTNLKGFAGGAIKNGVKGVLDALVKFLAKKTLDPRPKVADPIGMVDDVFQQRQYKLWVAVKYWSVERRFNWLWMGADYEYVEHTRYVEIDPPAGSTLFDGFWGGQVGPDPTAEQILGGILNALK